MKNKFAIKILLTVSLSLLCAVTVLSLSSCTGENDPRETDDRTPSASTGAVTRPPADDVIPRPDDTEDETQPPETDVLPFAEDILDLEVEAGQCFVFDTQSGEIIYMKGKGEKLYPASTTKLITIMYALTILDPEYLVTPGDELSLVGEFSTIAYIKQNHTLSVEMLIEGMLLPSGNDAAYVLAAAAGRMMSGKDDISGVDAVNTFVGGLNTYAVSLGMKNTHFTSPDGYYDDDHYTTVEDMAIVASLAIHNPIIMKYARVAKDNVTYASGHINTWTNTNRLIQKGDEYYSPYVTGLKTGSVGEGNYSLVVSADINGRTYTFGVFSEQQINTRFVDAHRIIDVLLER